MRLFLNEWRKFLTEDSEGGTVEDRAAKVQGNFLK